ncbi:hypothetical protein WICANDRAFT_65907 [Wickerhamomyces anomalus NRRL Y-366-8]|uniref:Uncharacterized protein n=1 Tax=Wickerhamomyces anomalus (strain ATCC 58044 / CBS 1984 / NCYC 433 / NRRL Y-366-8) TaxID=683960 RepID=A0A1E3NU31_WICAA|nr:uncharacterized protein WICANDRAFT_65907 [Wickerhamomyces anomalus NRRL Y-366-8]ODQ56628.1 hypothetical protein WICANDRAFT_65907 [Wickerhamomyces anomalus NRRL Y-366-8]
MNTTGSQRSSRVQRGCYMETRGGNTTFGVMIGALGLLFGEFGFGMFVELNFHNFGGVWR